MVSAIALGGFLIALALGSPQRLSTADQVASVAGALFAAAALVMSWRAAVRPPPGDPEALVGRAGDELARQVRRQWLTEADVRGLLRPEPLRVRWSSTGPVAAQVAAPAAEVAGAARETRATRLTADGDVTTLAATWRHLRVRRAVVIGHPGAGKTTLAMLLVCQLLADRDTGEPVPVLLNLSDWDPREEHLDAWLARRLTAYYPMLADRRRFGPDAARRLLDHELVLPVLDGLDEMAADLRQAAMEALTQRVVHAQPFVLTCRSVEYHNLIEATGTPLIRTAVVEIEPVTAAQAADYLPDGRIDGARRWAPVTAQLKSNPRGTLAQALSTPLMAYLARTMYSSPRTDPAVLTSFTDPAAVEEHLLRGYLPAVYAPRTTADDADRRRPHRHSPEQAMRWLTFLARHLQANRIHNLAWWRLVDAVPEAEAARDVRRYRLVAIVLVYADLLRLMVVAGESSAERVLRPQPIRRLQPGKLAHGVLFGLLMGSGIGLSNWFVFDLLRFPSAAAIGLSAGLFVGVAVLFGVWQGHLDFTSDKVREDVPLLDPRSALREDRISFLIVTLVSGLTCGAMFSLMFSLGTGLAAGATAGLVFGCAFGPRLGLGGGWLNLAAARISIAVRGCLPWRLMRFLDDAYRRGVLRQVGAKYQFRHARLQDYLARATDTGG